VVRSSHNLTLFVIFSCNELLSITMLVMT